MWYCFSNKITIHFENHVHIVVASPCRHIRNGRLIIREGAETFVAMQNPNVFSDPAMTVNISRAAKETLVFTGPSSEKTMVLYIANNATVCIVWLLNIVQICAIGIVNDVIVIV